jgi:hypothetical protein
VGYRFSLVLSREITDEESTMLKEAGCTEAAFGTDSLPTNADVTVTKMDFDDTISPSLEKAIESALQAVQNVPDLSVPGLTVPAQPAGPLSEESPGVVAGEVVESTVVESTIAESTIAESTVAEDAASVPVAESTPAEAADAPAAKRNGQATAAKNGASKATPKKASNGRRTTTRKTSSSDDAKDPAGAATGPA